MASGPGRQPESQQPPPPHEGPQPLKHDGMQGEQHGGPQGPQQGPHPIIGQQPVQHMLPQQTGLKAL
jgi:hypothetical protein